MAVDSQSCYSSGSDFCLKSEDWSSELTAERLEMT